MNRAMRSSGTRRRLTPGLMPPVSPRSTQKCLAIRARWLGNQQQVFKFQKCMDKRGFACDLLPSAV